VITQALAILIDSIRELKSRSLFWICLVLSAIVSVSLFGVLSFNEEGWRFLWFSTNESELLYKGSPDARRLVMLMFSLFVYWWLSWGAIILAIVSTSSMLPGFMAGGAVEITLAKPIRRLWLFLLKVLGALLFVFAQTLLAVVIAYLLLGLKEGIWVHAMWWTIPLIVLQFLYLYSIAALVAAISRSTLASLLITMLCWGLFSIVQFASNQLDKSVAQSEWMVDLYDQQIGDIRDEAEAQNRELTAFEINRIDSLRSQRDEMSRPIQFIAPYRKPVKAVELCVPKTGDIQRIIADITDAPTLSEALMGSGAFDSDEMRPAEFSEEDWKNLQQAGVVGDRAVRAVDRLESLGTSLAFTVIALGAAAFIFQRRDF
jgi:ABC-type transport system involved in multi-copper enzyme maturation permease subunit